MFSLHRHLPKQFDSNSSPACPTSVCRSPQVVCSVPPLTDVCGMPILTATITANVLNHRYLVKVTIAYFSLVLVGAH